MKLIKNVILFTSIALGIFMLVGCKPTEVTLEYKFAGIEDVTVENGATFNVLTGVKVLDQNNKEYTGITFVTTAAQVDKTSGNVDTKTPGEIKVRYEFTETKLQQWRTITIKSPAKVEGLLLQNGDFKEGTAYWTGDQGQVVLSVTDNVMQAEVVAGANAHEPRMYQMEIPFEQGKVYEVKFMGKASIAKTINLQVGELLDASPWFVDFKYGQPEVAALTTEWQEFSYKFKHNIENDRGGVLFEFGKVQGVQVDGTVWLKDITIEESELGADVTAPAITGTQDVTLLLGTPFDVAAGVQAFDGVDGEVTEDLEIVIKNSEGAIITEIDPDVEGTYTVTYTVSDAAGNEAEVITTIVYKAIQFKDENLVVNGDFTMDDAEYSLGEGDSMTVDENWALWFAKKSEGGEGNTGTAKIENGKLHITTTLISGPDYGIQLNQENLTLVEGQRYLFSFKASSSVARTINIKIGQPFDTDPWFSEYKSFYGIELTPEEKEYSFSFVNTQKTNELVKIEFNFGNFGDPALSTITLDDVRLSESAEPQLITYDLTDEAHIVHLEEGGDPFGTATREANKIELVVTAAGTLAHQPHYGFEVAGLDVGAYTFKLDIKSSIARKLRFNVVKSSTDWSSILDGGNFDFDVVAGEDKTFQITINVTSPITETLKFELDFGPLEEIETNTTGTYVLSNLKLYKQS